jgi:hypothetical protein
VTSLSVGGYDAKVDALLVRVAIRARAVLGGAALALLLFGQAFVRLRRRGGATTRHGAAPALRDGVAVATLALVSPLDAMGSYLLSAHMLQHVLIGAAVPALILVAHPRSPRTPRAAPRARLVPASPAAEPGGLGRGDRGLARAGGCARRLWRLAETEDQNLAGILMNAEQTTVSLSRSPRTTPPARRGGASATGGGRGVLRPRRQSEHPTALEGGMNQYG